MAEDRNTYKIHDTVFLGVQIADEVVAIIAYSLHRSRRC